MSIVMGPVLGFQGVSTEDDKSIWRLGVLLVTEGGGKPVLSWSIGKDAMPAPQPVHLAVFGNRQVWRFDLAIPHAETKTEVSYAIGAASKRHLFVVPALGRTPRVAYSSCNGFSSLRAMKLVDDNNALWKDMATRHAKEPYHLILMGGDQLYADSMWETIDLLKEWAALPFRDGNKAKFTPAMKAALQQFYFGLYCTRWSQPEFAAMVASIPTVMMWDDHDIFDGWGSYKPERQGCPVYKGIFEQARAHFDLFQMHGRPGPDSEKRFLCPGNNFSFAHRVGTLAIVAADMRSERTNARVMRQQSWDSIFNWIDAQHGCHHLYFMSSIPVVHPDFNLVERALGLVPGHQDLEDDLRDHWSSRPHKAERLRLIHRLLKFAKEKPTRVTLLSGDVHVAALGTIANERPGVTGDNAQVINQLTSSGIVHPAPSGLVLYALEHLFEKVDEVDRGVVARMHKLPGTEHRFIGARNWLSLEPDDVDTAKQAPRIWANWLVERDTDVPYTKVIHPCGDEFQVEAAGS